MEVTGITYNSLMFLKTYQEISVKKEAAPTTKRHDPSQDKSSKIRTVEPPLLRANRAFFVVDGKGKVVIQIVDSEGNFIKQIPPESFQRGAAMLEENMKNLMDLEG